MKFKFKNIGNLEEFNKYRSKRGLKTSRKRTFIIKYFLNEDRHFSVEELYNKIRKIKPNIGFSTVYRTLKLLAECGMASECNFDGISRYEFEYEVPVEDGYHMMELFCEDIVQKTRYKFKEEGKIWEVDIFKEDNDGLILAEVELESEDEEIAFPYFIGKEVTDDERYYNKNLAKYPYKKWKRLYTSYFNSTTFEYKDAVSIAGKSPAYYSGAEYKKLDKEFSMDGVMGVTLRDKGNSFYRSKGGIHYYPFHPWISNPWSIPSIGTRGFLLGKI